MSLQIGFFVRTDQATKAGGDVIQAKGYADALGRRGMAARLIGRPEELAGLDILHVFNLDRPWDCLPLARRAWKLGCTVVLSPIAHPREDVRRYQAERSFWWERRLVRAGLGGDFSERLKAVARAVGSANAPLARTALRHGLRWAGSELWQLAAGIQLLSSAEREELLRQGLDFEGKATEIVRNGVDLSIRVAPIDSPALVDFIRRHGRFALVGGRIEPRKNQIEVAHVAAELGIPLVFVGQLNLHHRAYCRDFQQLAKSQRQMLYAGGMAREIFARLLTLAHLHVSASLFEVSPLVDLEARAMGCRVVATRASLGTEFLDGYAELCDPWSNDSIKAAMARAWAAPDRAPALCVPTWDHTAEPLMKLYQAARAVRPYGRC